MITIGDTFIFKNVDILRQFLTDPPPPPFINPATTKFKCISALPPFIYLSNETYGQIAMTETEIDDWMIKMTTEPTENSIYGKQKERQLYRLLLSAIEEYLYSHSDLSDLDKDLLRTHHGETYQYIKALSAEIVKQQEKK